jgi:hypothetical protein
MSRSPLVTQLSYSAGTASHALLQMVLLGEIERPRNFIVINADPGMENSVTYKFVDQAERECRSAGIPFLRTGSNLYTGLLSLKASGSTRFDLPPLWTRNRVTGKKGRLLQRCTKWAKIAPMDRALRGWMHANLGISKSTKSLGIDTVCKWIGFTQDEWMRISEAKQKYVYFDYPLIDRGITKATLAEWYGSRMLEMPPRSVCNACYANDIEHYRLMLAERPDEFWNQAVAVDEAIRDLRHVGVEDECFVSSTLIPLRELANLGFLLPLDASETVDEKCHTGYCFT